MGDVLEHIDSWQAAGIIDEATAGRLRAAEAGSHAAGLPSQRMPSAAPPPATSSSPVLADPGSAASVFGPAVSIGELFGYLGGLFLLGAWAAFVSQFGGDSEVDFGLGFAAAAVAVAVMGVVLRRGDARRLRAAGVCFLISTVLAMGAGYELAEYAGLEAPVTYVVAGILGVAAGVGFRWFHPALLTQVAMLTGLMVLAGAGLQSISDTIAPPAGWDEYGTFTPRSGPDPIILVIGQAAWWLAWAFGIGYLGLMEDRQGRQTHDGAARRRAALTRLWAGLVAVLGLTAAVRLEDAPGEYYLVRVVPPWLGDLAILVLCAVLIERAFRRDATAFIWAAALGVAIALTDLNVTYLADNTWVALLLEGAILVVVGFTADRLRRELRGWRARGAAPAT